MNKAERIKELEELRQAGSISDEEFTALKKEVVEGEEEGREEVVPPQKWKSVSDDSSKDDAAALGFVLGVLSLFSWLIPLLGLPISIVGIVQAAKGQKSQKKVLSTLGMVLSIIGLICTLVSAGIGFYQGATGEILFPEYQPDQS